MPMKWAGSRTNMFLQPEKDKLLEVADRLGAIGWSLTAAVRFLVWVYLPPKKVGSTALGA